MKFIIFLILILGPSLSRADFFSESFNPNLQVKFGKADIPFKKGQTTMPLPSAPGWNCSLQLYTEASVLESGTLEDLLGNKTILESKTKGSGYKFGDKNLISAAKLKQAYDIAYRPGRGIKPKDRGSFWFESHPESNGEIKLCAKLLSKGDLFSQELGCTVSKNHGIFSANDIDHILSECKKDCGIAFGGAYDERLIFLDEMATRSGVESRDFDILFEDLRQSYFVYSLRCEQNPATGKPPRIDFTDARAALKPAGIELCKDRCTR